MAQKNTPKFVAPPAREYCDGDRKMVSMRFPVKLLEELENISKDDGWTTTDIVLTALDQYVQWKKSKS
jgi:hypothetical protein